MTPTASLAVSQQTLLYLLPEILLIAAATAIITAAAFVTKKRAYWSMLAAGALLAALLAFFGTQSALATQSLDPYKAVVSPDWLAYYGRLGILLSGFVLLGLAHDQVDAARAPEFFGSMLFVIAGAMIAVSANDLVLLFVGLELVSIPTYLLLYLPRRTDQTQESTLKYFYLSIFSSALLLFGLAYIYGLTGLTNLKSVQYLVHWNGSALRLPQPVFATIALVFVMAGLGFRVACVPFHFYAPDVYQGSPTIMAALLAWIPKAIGFVAMLRVTTALFGWDPNLPAEIGVMRSAASFGNLAAVSEKAVSLTWILAVVTLVLGNTVALAQTNLKRLLAYSSIAHAGYLLVGVAAAFRNGPGGTEGVLGADAVVFYLATYALATLGAFGVILLLHTPERPVETIDDLSGLWQTHRWAALAFVLCLFSLAGIPPLAGFWGKFRIFQSALEVARGDFTRPFQWLTVIAVINAAIGAYYYLRLIVTMIFREPSEPVRMRAAWPTAWAVGVCAAFSLIIGLSADALAVASRDAGQSLVALPAPTSAASPIPQTASR